MSRLKLRASSAARRERIEVQDSSIEHGPQPARRWSLSHTFNPRALLARIIERGLVKDGRLVRLRVHLPDYPGALHRLTGILAQHRANIVETS